VALNKDALAVEYWFRMTLQPEPDDADGQVYVGILQRMWLAKLGELCPELAYKCLGYSQCGYKMKYFQNDLRMWFIPAGLREERSDRVLREAPTQKDKWYSEDTLVLTYPPLPDEKFVPDLAQFFFRETLQEPRYNDPEVQGGKIALVEVQQQSVQKPPISLDHKHSSFLKQVAYNQRVFKAEDAIASINTEIADFLLNFSTDPADQVVICVSAGEQMKRHE
jgi:hypothetical protein